jgi:hypothetical protein
MDPMIIILSIAALVCFSWSLFLTILYIRQQQLFKTIMVGISKQDLKSIFENILARNKKQDALLSQLKDAQEKDRADARKHLQKYALVRFNPFEETGGDQSFSMSLLNADNEGFVVTSLHSRDVTRVYGKTLGSQDGGNTSLSREEQTAVSNAMKGSA